MNPHSEALRAAAGLVRKPTRLLWLAPLIMAMDGPGCVVSESPLTSPRRAIVDEHLLGDWAYAESPEQIAIRIRQRDDRMIEVHWFIDDSGEYFVLTGFVSGFEGGKHANLQFVGTGCEDCSDEAAAEFARNFEQDFATIVPDDPANRCTWATVSYEHLDDGRMRIGTLSPRAVLERIDAGELRGQFDEDADGSVGSGVVCITESRRGLRRFVDETAFNDSITDSELLVRYRD